MDTIIQLWAGIDWVGLGVWTLTICLMLVGIAGSVLPILPGPLLIFIGGVLHTFLRPQSGMSVAGIVLLALFLVIAYAVDIGSSALGAKWFGASRWGIAGVLLGGLVGLFFGIPGLLLGPILGGLFCEIVIAEREWRAGVKGTWGAVVGTGIGLVLRLGISIVMVVVFLVDALWW